MIPLHYDKIHINLHQHDAYVKPIVVHGYVKTIIKPMFSLHLQSNPSIFQIYRGVANMQMSARFHLIVNSMMIYFAACCMTTILRLAKPC